MCFLRGDKIVLNRIEFFFFFTRIHKLFYKGWDFGGGGEIENNLLTNVVAINTF